MFSRSVRLRESLVLVTVLHFASLESIFCDKLLRSGDSHRSDDSNSIRCALLVYEYSDAAQCFDHLTEHFQLNDKPLHFAFVGDSRIRQAFHSFWPMIPDYDLMWNTPVNRKVLAFHSDMQVHSSIQNTLVSFRWRPEINEVLIGELEKLVVGNTPNLIVTGFSGHHMEQRKPRSYIEYEEWLTQLAPTLKALSGRTVVIWLHQNPIIETYGNKNGGHAILRSATNRKYDMYNMVARRILNDTGVFFWESGYAMAEEYVRSCAINDRTDSTNRWACFDFIHTGYIVLDSATQILFNALCNRLLLQRPNSQVTNNQKLCCS